MLDMTGVMHCCADEKGLTMQKDLGGDGGSWIATPKSSMPTTGAVGAIDSAKCELLELSSGIREIALDAGFVNVAQPMGDVFSAPTCVLGVPVNKSPNKALTALSPKPWDLANSAKLPASGSGEDVVMRDS